MHPVVHVAHVLLLDSPESVALHRIEHARVFVSVGRRVDCFSQSEGGGQGVVGVV